MDLLRRALNHRVTVGGALETVMWLGLAWVIVGITVTLFHLQYVRAVETQLERRLPAGSELVAFGEITLMWPGLLLTDNLCMV